jgi:cytochrome c-type biogenesis protein CcmE
MTAGVDKADVVRVLPVESPSTTTAAPSGSRRGDRRKLSRLGVVGLILAVALCFLIYKAVTSAVVYFKTAQQAVAARYELGNSTFQIEGLVVPGSIHKDGVGSVRTFVISSGPVRLHITNSAPQPALFQANVPVVLVGHFVGSSNTFASDQILVKHSNSYIAAHPNRVRAPNGSVH